MARRDMAKHLRAFRSAQGYKNQQEFAARCGLSAKEISKIETGKTSPTLTTIELICINHGITVYDFFNFTDCFKQPVVPDLVSNKRKLVVDGPLDINIYHYVDATAEEIDQLEAIDSDLDDNPEANDD